MKLKRIAFIVLVGFVYAAVPFTAEFGIGNASVQAAEDKKTRQKTRRVPAMSEQTFKKLSEAQEFLDLKDYQGALLVLNKMLDRRKRLNGNEIGQVHNMLGFVYFSMDDFEGAIREYEAVIAQGDKVTEGLETTVLYTLAQLSFVVDSFEDALRYMEIWIEKATNPGPEPRIFMGQVYYQMQDFPNAIVQIEFGIQVAVDRGTAVKENWWGLLNYLYFEQENWPKVLEILEILVRDFPKREYWVRLAGVYGQQEQEKEQLYSMQAAYTAGFLERETDLNNFAGLLMQDEVPFRAATVLAQGFKDGTVEKTAKNLRNLGQAWQLSQEVAKAIPVFEDAGKLSDDGKIFERLAHLYLEDDQYSKCVSAANNALEKGGLRKVQTTHVVRGMCLYNQDKLVGARGSFVSCRNESRRVKDAGGRRMCQQWITHIDNESKRRKALADAI
ncbi:MAG: hypothetical protein O7E57_09465 [Gammaproteobacteria bacterium]|nr:hypothetical protein [Gammaproteobacteria bacterium]MCZ6855882.1 hypothetical protein [Gammaproteobacteria bacterium]